MYRSRFSRSSRLLDLLYKGKSRDIYVYKENALRDSFLPDAYTVKRYQICIEIC